MVWLWGSIAVGEIPKQVLLVLQSCEVVALPKPKTSDVRPVLHSCILRRYALKAVVKHHPVSYTHLTLPTICSV
eukprot:11565128-Prorocentrum_lima.AAC.1